MPDLLDFYRQTEDELIKEALLNPNGHVQLGAYSVSASTLAQKGLRHVLHELKMAPRFPVLADFAGTVVMVEALPRRCDRAVVEPRRRCEMQIELGALSDDLQDQLVKAKMEYVGTVPIELLQRAANGISLLHVRGYLSDAEATRARKRLVKDIKVMEYNHDQ